MRFGARRRGRPSRSSLPVLAYFCGVLVGPVAAAQEADPAGAWERKCNDTLGYIGCAEMMHPGPHRAGPPPRPDVWGALAVSASTLDWGSSWNSKSEPDASAFALRICAAKGAHDCKIVKTVADVCLS